MFNNKFQQRLKALFADIERLAADPACDSLAVRRDLEELRGRLCKLEKEFLENQKQASTAKEVVVPQNEAVKARPAAPVLYEKERIAFAFSDDKLVSVEEAQSTETHFDHAMTALLTASGQPIGEMQIESPAEHQWTSEDANLANAVAQQASLQIQLTWQQVWKFLFPFLVDDHMLWEMIMVLRA